MCFFPNIKLPRDVRVYENAVVLHEARFFCDTVEASLTPINGKLLLHLCEQCQLKALHALVSHGTKCVIMVQAVADSVCPFTINPHSPLLPLQIVKSSVSDTGREFFFVFVVHKHSSSESVAACSVKFLCNVC